MSARIPVVKKEPYVITSSGGSSGRQSQRDALKVAALYLQAYGSVTIVKVNHENGK